MSEKPTRDHFYEMMDRAHMLQEHLQAALGGHPAIVNDTLYQRLYKEIEINLIELLASAGLEIEKIDHEEP